MYPIVEASDTFSQIKYSKIILHLVGDTVPAVAKRSFAEKTLFPYKKKKKKKPGGAVSVHTAVGLTWNV